MCLYVRVYVCVCVLCVCACVRACVRMNVCVCACVVLACVPLFLLLYYNCYISEFVSFCEVSFFLRTILVKSTDSGSTLGYNIRPSYHYTYVKKLKNATFPSNSKINEIS